MSEQELEIREALRAAIDEEMERDPRVFLLGEEVAEYQGAYKVSKGLLEKYGKERIIDTPICEAGFTGLAVGAAMTGLRPIVEFMSFNFSFVAFDQIVSNAIKMYYMTAQRYRVPIVFRGCNGAAKQVSCQHSKCVEAIYAHFPGLKVVFPSNPYDAKGLLKSAIRDDNPVMVLESELDYGIKGMVPDHEYLVEIGKANVLEPGSDLTLITWGRMVAYCKEALKELRSRYKVELIDLRSIRPLDIATIAKSVRKTGHVVVVEEGHQFASIASEISMQIMETCFDYLDAPMIRVCQRDNPMPYAKNLEYATLPNKERIIEAVQRVMEGE